MADSAGVGSPQPGDGAADGYVQVQPQAPSTSPGDKFSLENSSDETAMRRPGTAHTMATQLGGGGTPVSAAQAESKQPQSGAERLLKMLHRNIGTMQRNVETRKTFHLVSFSALVDMLRMGGSVLGGGHRQAPSLLFLATCL